METDLGLDAIDRRNYELMSSLLKRTCLSAESALTGRPNVESVPLGAKLPMIPGSNLVLHTTNICKTLHVPFCYFDRTFSSDAYLGGEYNCLHDPHLKRFFENRPDITKKLCSEKFITPERKVVCSLKEYNLYRQYLKHLSVQYLNTKYAEQCKKEVAKKNQEIILRMKEKYRAANSRIRQKVENVKDTRSALEKETENRRKELVSQMHEYTEKREKEKKKERLRKITLVKKREKIREQRIKDRVIKEYQDMIFRQKLHALKYAQDAERRQSFEEKIQFERKCKEMALIDSYERKKLFHEMYIAKLNKVVADVDARRRTRIAEWESYFAKKQKSTLDGMEAIKLREKQAREEARKRFEERLRRKGWTGSACRPKTIFGGRTRRNDSESNRGKIKVVRQLSALGFHNVTLPTGILKAICSLEKDDPSGDDLKFHQKPDLQSFADNMVSQIIGISKNVLLPLLESYERKTGVKVSAAGIPSTLQELSSGVFAEEEDQLPQVLSIHDGHDVTAYAGSKKSNVRFRVSNTDLPLDLGVVKNRPPTPKKVRFSSSSSSDAEHAYMTSDSRMLLEETVKKLSEKVVQQIFANANLVDQEIQREEMQERVNNVAKSIIDEIVMFGLESACFERTPSISPSEADSTQMSTSVEEKISELASHLVIDVVPGMHLQTSGSSTSTASQRSIESNISVLALRVVKSILGTVDRKSGKTIGHHLAMRKDLEEKITNLSAKVVEDVAKARHRFSPEELESSEFTELEEKISKLALNIITTVHEGKRPASAVSRHSVSHTGVEERVLSLAARIIGGLISLKKSLPKDKSLSGDLRARPANSVERLLRELFQPDALTDSREAVHSDVRKMSYDIARRLIMDRDGGSAVESGLTDLGVAMEKRSNKKSVRADRSSDSERDRQDKRSTTSGETRISSALSEIAELVSQNAIQKEEIRAQSSFSSGASNLASHVTDRAIVKAIMGHSSSKSSGMNSGISKLAGTAVKHVLHDAEGIDSNTRSAIASEIKVLAEKIMWQAVEMAVVDPDSLDSTTRKAISSGASTLATQVAGMVSGSQSGSSSAMDTLESILSSAVSDMVADMLTQRVLLHAKGQDVEIEEDQLSSEVEKLVRTLLGMKNRESCKMSSAEYPSTFKDDTTVTSSTSATSSVALDVVKTFLSKKSSKDRVSDQDSSSAISEVASKYVYEVLGMNPPGHQRQTKRSRRNEETFEMSSSTGNSTNDDGLTKRRSTTKNNDWSNDLTNGKESLHPKPRNSAAYSTSFMDWRYGQTGAVVDHAGKISCSALHEIGQAQLNARSSAVLHGENTDEFNNIMDSLAKRIVSSIITNPDAEGEAQVDRMMINSPSVEELVGNMALGVVTSLLGLDVLSNTTTSDSESDRSTSAEAGRQSTKNSEQGNIVPGPSTGQTDQLPPVSDKSTDTSLDQRIEAISIRKPSSSLLSIFSTSTVTADGGESTIRSVCEDTAQEHPFRVRSPTGRDLKVTPKVVKQKMRVSHCNDAKNRKDMTSKSRRKKALPDKIQLPLYPITPVKQSSGFLDRRWLNNSMEKEKAKEKLPPIEHKKLLPQSSDRESKSNLKNMFL